MNHLEYIVYRTNSKGNFNQVTGSAYIWMYNMTDKVWKQRNVATTYKQKVFSHQLIFCANLNFRAHLHWPQSTDNQRKQCSLVKLCQARGFQKLLSLKCSIFLVLWARTSGKVFSLISENVSALTRCIACTFS